MNKVLKVALGLILLYVLVMGGSGLAIQALLSGETGARLREQAQASLPVELSIQGGDFDLAGWFFFRPALSFDHLRVENPEGFSDEPLLTADQVSARADLRSLLGDGLEIAQISIVAPDLLVETDAAGRTNIDALLEAASSGETAVDAPPADDAEAQSVRVGSFAIEDGTVRYVTPGEPPMTVKNLSVAVDDFDPEASFPIHAELDLFEEEAVHLSFEGTTGPFTPTSSPATGALNVEAMLAKLPEQFRVDNLGDFIVSPGSGSRLNLNADLEGDLLDDFSGDGAVAFSDILLGKAEKPQLPLSGDAPIRLSIRNALANPSWALRMPDATLTLGQGTWSGNLSLRQDGDRIAGQSSGAIRGVDVNELLTALTDSEDTLFGLLELERYSLSFDGRDAEEIQNSFQGAGRLDLTDGKLAVFDTLKTIEQKVNRVLKGEQSVAEGVTSFVRFGTDFQIADRRVTTPNLLLENDSARIGGAGSFGFDQDLDYNVSSLISGPLAELLGGSANAEGVAQAAAPLRVSGTMESPRVFLDVKGIAKKAAVDQAKGFLGNLLNRNREQPAEGEAAAEGEATEEEQPKKKGLPFGLGGILDKALEDKPAEPEPQP